MEQKYDFLSVLISRCVREGATPLVAGDFNASIRRAHPHDEIEFLGFCGCGHRNAGGWSLIDWVLGNGLLIQNRMDTTMNNDASWTCHRSFDGALVQLDFVTLGAHVSSQPFLSKTGSLSFAAPGTLSPCRCAKCAGTVTLVPMESHARPVPACLKATTYGALGRHARMDNGGC